MDWVRRIGDVFSPSEEPTDEAEADPGPEPVERAAPGVAALFEATSEDGSHSVLDLGSATGSSLRVYRRFARRVRFADLHAQRAEQGLGATLDVLPSEPDRPYDMVFAWDVLDRLPPRGRTRLMERLVRITAPDARLHLVVDASATSERKPPLRFTLLGLDRVRCEPAGPARTVRERLLPSDVEELLEPFRVTRGFTLKAGLREYVAARGKPAERSSTRPV